MNQKTTSVRCKRCAHHFLTAEGYAGVHISQGVTPAAQIRNGRSFHLCSECADGLASWIGIVPEPPEQEFALNGRPFGHYFEH